jgi:hypothetical protein
MALFLGRVGGVFDRLLVGVVVKRRGL